MSAENVKIECHVLFGENLRDDNESHTDQSINANPEDCWIFFQSLWNEEVSVSLPCPSWAVYFLDDVTTIAFTQVKLTSDQKSTIISKKLILNKSRFKCYVFDHLIANSVVFKKNYFQNVSELEEVIKNFDSLEVKTCEGGLRIEDAPTYFTSNFHYKDLYHNVWRHVECPYMLDSASDSVKCEHCEKMKIRVWK